MDPIFYFLAAIIGAVIFGATYYFTRKRQDPILIKILEHLTRFYLDEKKFTLKKLSEELQLPEDVIEKALVKLEKAGLVMRISGGYVLVDPLVFLTPQDYERAIRLSKDNIIYGAYQLFYLAHPLIIVIQAAILLIPVILLFLVAFNFYGIADMIRNFFGGQVDPIIFSLFLLAISILLLDIINNFLKMYTREKYSVVVGFHAGILYDTNPSDELSGRITRGSISRVDIDINWSQKLNNLFGTIPVGDVEVWVHGRKTPIVFKSLPYPRELYSVIRSIQLGSLQWRKRHARELALWRGRIYPFYTYSKRRRK